MTLVSPKKINSPCLVHVYGVCGEILEPQFSLQTAALLQRGWAVAFAHVRGGGERGSEWNVKKEEKVKSVEDLKECVDFLISEKVTSREKVCGFAASSGGAILGAALNLWGKKIFSAAVLRAPFLDVIESLKNPKTPLALLEREEWGNPEIAEDLEFLKGFSPVENVRDESGFYPPIFMSAAEDDARVPIIGTQKYAEKMSRANCDFLFLQFPAGGHSVGENFENEAIEIAFLQKSLNLPR